MVTLPRRKFERGGDIPGFEQCVVAEDFLTTATRSQQVEHISDPDAQAAQATPPATKGRIDCHPVQFARGRCPVPAGRSPWQPRWDMPILYDRLSPKANTMATNTLDAVRQRLAAEDSELRRRGVCHLAVFGSVARGDDRPDSDVDVAVEIEAGRSFSLIRMEDTRLFLEDTLRRRVDLGEIDTFRPQVRAAFERERVPIF